MRRAPAPRRMPRRSPTASVHPLERRDLLATFVVTTTEDAGPGSLRDAIVQANATPTADVVRFDIPGDGLYRTIAPLSPLPEILAPLTIDGRTQPGYVSSPVIEISGALAGAGADGLTVAAPQSVVRALAINRFDGHGVVLAAARPRSPTLPAAPGAAGARVDMCFIGTDVTGNVPLPNTGAGIRIVAPDTYIGASGARAPSPTNYRNVISGNGFAGVWIVQSSVQNSSGRTTLVNNYIGTNAGGNRALGNGREGVLIQTAETVEIGTPFAAAQARNVISGNAASGVRVAPTTARVRVNFHNNYIGTDAAGANALGNGQSPVQPFRDGITIGATGTVRVGAPQPNARNLISGNAGAGVAFYSAELAEVTGNFIGTDATGNVALGNGGNGVTLVGRGSRGTVTGNLISGNAGDGIHANRSDGALVIAGNYIGTNASAGSALGNGGDGVELFDVRAIARIDGSGGFTHPTPPAAPDPASIGRNVISANGGNGIKITSGAAPGMPHIVTGNFVGTDFAGLVPLGNALSGVYLATTGVIVGGAAAGPVGQANLISANGANGITIVTPANSNFSPGQPVNRIEGNRIGVAVTPRLIAVPNNDAIMGNRHHGIAVLYSSNNRIGSGTPTGGNIIAHNGGSGVMVQGTSGASPNSHHAADGNLITANSIYNNGGLGIDLVAAGEGVTPNDPLDADTGPNALQNHPVITEALGVPGGFDVTGRFTLHAEPNKSYQVEIFASLAPDLTGRGEGQAFLRSVAVTTDALGNAAGVFVATYPVSITARMTPTSPSFLSATATENTRRNTSEFSPAVRVTLRQPEPVPPALFRRGGFSRRGFFEQQPGV